jgi:TolB-like protein
MRCGSLCFLSSTRSRSEIENFADGLAGDITAALSQFSYLSVIARESTERPKPQDVRAAREQLGARYVIPGGIHKSEP